MFGYKKVIEEGSPIAIEYKRLWNEMIRRRENIEDTMLTLIARENMQSFYTTSQLAAAASKRLDQARQDFNEAISLYDNALCNLEKYYVVNQFIIDKELPTWYPSRWEEGIAMAEQLYCNKYQSWARK